MSAPPPIPRADAGDASAPTHERFRRGFGSELEARRQVLSSSLAKLRPSMPEAAQSMLEWLSKHLDSQSCSIAVIGQVKSGKSSFINAFIDRPGFLPTDINPWTTAVTRLHFGSDPGGDDFAARFTFFDQDEWQRFDDQGGRLRELTERFVPGFEPELLRQHVVQLRKRAEARLGSSLADYLGTAHQFSEFVPGLLETYVCDSASGGAAGGQPHFSDIVKSADVVFGNKDFDFPTVLIDTPGTNDPFLVRDEITRRTLDSADIHIVVLIARQALSLSDVALFRILRGLHKERIVVFINRIDELDDPATNAPLVVEEVKRGLRREFPGSEIPVIAGSAYWAEAALRGDHAEIAAELTPSVRAYLAQSGRATRASSAGKVEALQLPADDLYQGSGLPALVHALGGLSRSGHASHVMRQIADSLIELGQVSLAGARNELDSLIASHASATTNGQSIDAELADISARITETERLLDRLNNYFVDVGARTARVVDERCESLFDDLYTTTLQYAAHECERLRQTLAGGASGGVWNCDTSGIRSLLETQVMSHFRSSNDELWALYDHVVPSMQRLLNEWQVDADFRGSRKKHRPNPLPPSISALGQFISLDVSEPFWKRWLALGASPDERAATLENLILREFRRVIDALVEATRSQLAAIEGIIQGDLTRNFMLFAEALQEHSKNTFTRMTELQQARQAMDDVHIWQSKQARIGELSETVAQIEPILADLSQQRQGWRF